MKDKKIVVTGGAGFIGSHLAWSLCDANDVVVVDNLSTGRLANVSLLVNEKKIRFVRGSITDLRLMRGVCRGIDYVFHEAAVPSVARSVKDPLTTNEVGISGTLVTLIASRDSGVRKVVSASSSSVYGETSSLPKREDMIPNPISPYSLTKLTGERYCELFSEIYGLRTVSLRYFNVYGPRQDPDSEYAAVIPRFVQNALTGRRLIIFGDGSQTRDFTYVGDVVQANIKAATSKAGGAINIGSGRRLTINALARTVIEITDSRSRIAHEQPRVGEIKHSLADIEKARIKLGYLPHWSLRDGLREMISYMAQEHHPRRS